MAIAIVLILLVIGSVIFHLLSPWYLTPLASNWGAIDHTITITFWVCGIVFVAINLFMAYAIIRFRNKSKDQRALYEPENKRLEGWLTIVTTVGVVAMLAPGLFVWAKFVEVPQDAMQVEAVGQQWQWSFRFPGADGKFGIVDSKYVTVDNPFGLKPEDPDGKDDVLIPGNEVHLPLGKPVKVLLRSKDVLHNFAVAQFRVKMDLVPGLVSYLWFTPTRTGEFEILCEEYCGIAHHSMRGKVVVDEDVNFQTWLSKQPTFAQHSTKEPINLAAGEATYAVCSACHGAQGEGNQAMNAPKLSGQNDWYLKRQLIYFKHGIRGSTEGDALGQQMAQMAATLPDEATINNLIVYIKTLPDQPPAATIQGNAKRGKKIYETCEKCHGVNGQGAWGANGPRLAGMSDWYMASQLHKFKQKQRGVHPQDITGRQMESIVLSLDDQKIKDVVAYMHTLQ